LKNKQSKWIASSNAAYKKYMYTWNLRDKKKGCLFFANFPDFHKTLFCSFLWILRFWSRI